MEFLEMGFPQFTRIVVNCFESMNFFRLYTCELVKEAEMTDLKRV